MTQAVRQTLWQAIADSLRADIAAGHHRPGERLPTEAQLAARFGVNRHTVRQGVAALVEEGLVVTRRGSGAFVAARPVDYPLGRRVRFGLSIRAAGRAPGRRGTVTGRRADAEEAAALGLPDGAAVHVWEGVSLVDGAPVALFRSVFPAERLPDLPRHLRDTGSVTEALARAGIGDYIRVATRLVAKLATPTQAAQLGLALPAPLLRSVAVNADLEGRPVERGTTWFAGDRIALTLEE